MSGFDLLYDAADMVIVADTDATVADINARVATDGLFFPLCRDPAAPLVELFTQHFFAPRSFRFGSIADNVLGMNFRLHNNTRLKIGGRVVKNVTGFDFTRFFSRTGTPFGTVERAVLRLRARAECFARREITGTADAVQNYQQKLIFSTWAHVIDAVDFIIDDDGGFHLLVGFSCARAEVQFFSDMLDALAQECDCRCVEPTGFADDLDWLIPPGNPLAQVKTTLSRAPRIALALHEKWGGSVHGFAGNGSFYFSPAAASQNDPGLIAALQRLHVEQSKLGGHVTCAALVYPQDSAGKAWEDSFCKQLEILA